MNRTLAVVAIVGLALSAMFFSLAAARGGAGLAWLRDDNWFDGFGDGFVGDRPVMASAGMKQWNWSGDDLQIEIPAEIHVIPPEASASAATIVVRGPQRLVNRVQFRDGKLALTGYNKSFLHEDHLDVRIQGRFKQYDLAVGSLKLGHVEQDKLTVRISGAGEISGEGKVKDLDVAISGVGGAEFGRLEAQNARVRISGAGEAKIRPREKADISLSGIGEVDLRSQPKSLVKHISGLGHVEEAEGDDDDDKDDN